MATSVAKDITSNISNLSRSVSNTLSLSTSPTASFHSPPSSFHQLKRSTTGSHAKQLKPFATEDIKILLLENVNQTGHDILAKQGYQVEALKTSLPEHELIEKIRWGSLIDKKKKKKFHV
jgi:D-3-phosphoglycerate dehydrogenase